MMTGELAHETVILATNSRPLALGLTALLLTISPIDKVICLPDAAGLLENLAGTQPELIVLDAALAECGTCELIEEVRRQAPHSQMVILTESPTELRELTRVSRGTVVMKGTDPARLVGIIESLLEGHLT